ncbi:hypothetical protein DY000_02059967 [Brassica cretica]|uniref:Uncharacterized protein n=1 Tax=Brassica cretica TaxID=69181 RepID=A0ABQ7ANU0_BRACR|nr:hypothetical protein DY000_02059967 [Brassica cretica]
MVSQILWLGVKDVFTQIAKDVVGHASDRGTFMLTLSLMKIESFWSEEDEAQEVKVAWSYEKRFCCDFHLSRMTRSFLERIGQPEVDLANDREESVPFNVHDITSILEFSSSQMFSMLFSDSLSTTETERNALVLEDFS